LSEMDKSTITILVNGQVYISQAGNTVADLLHEFNVTPKYVVVQLDGEIVPRTGFEQAVLREGCKVEIVTLVGGG
jgi:sulfur carrier protein